MPMLHRSVPSSFLLPGLLALLLGGCSATAPAPRGEAQSTPMVSSELAQSDVNRMATLGMRDNLDSLLRLGDKLYRRNPAEWRKTGLASREAALAQLGLSYAG